jgi:type I restriction enzyme, S subunit
VTILNEDVLETEDVGSEDIPSNWVWTTVEEFASTSSGGTPSRANSFYYVGEIPWVKSGELGDGIVKRTEEHISEEALRNSSAKLFPKGTLLIALYGATVGKLGILEIEASTNQAVCGIFLPDAIHTKYMFYLLASLRQKFINSSQGGAQPNISQDIVRKTVVPLPSTNEQGRIVEKLEELFTKLDAGVKTLERTRALLKRYRQSVLKAAVEGKLTAAWRETHQHELEPASELLERILEERRSKWEAEQLEKMHAKGLNPLTDAWKAKYEEPTGPDVSSLPELPAGWIRLPLESVAQVVDPQPSHRTPAEFPDGIPYIGMGDTTKDGRIDLINARKVSPDVFDEHKERYTLQPGDFIFGKIGTLGNPVVLSQPFNYTLSANVILIQPRSRFLENRFLLFYMNSPEMDYLLAIQSRATTQAAFGIQRVRQLPIPLPSVIEQTEIAIEVERQLSIVDALETSVVSDLKRAERLRQSILKRAFAGKLVPQDPNDEPASELLHRIQLEKAQQLADHPKQRATRAPKDALEDAASLTDTALKRTRGRPAKNANQNKLF